MGSKFQEVAVEGEEEECRWFLRLLKISIQQWVAEMEQWAVGFLCMCLSLTRILKGIQNHRSILIMSYLNLLFPIKYSQQHQEPEMHTSGLVISNKMHQLRITNIQAGLQLRIVTKRELNLNPVETLDLLDNQG